MGANKRGILPFLVGIAAGIATGFWLNSEEGKDWRRETAEKAKSKATDLKEKAGEAAERVNEYVSETVDKIKHMASETASDLKRKYRDKVNPNKETKHTSTREAVQDGIKKAHKHLDDLEEKTD